MVASGSSSSTIKIRFCMILPGRRALAAGRAIRSSLRQREAEGSSALRLALDPDAAAVLFHDRLDDAQSQTRAALALDAAIAAAKVGLEHPPEFLGHDSIALVSDLDFHEAGCS